MYFIIFKNKSIIYHTFFTHYHHISKFLYKQNLLVRYIIARHYYTGKSNKIHTLLVSSNTGQHVR